MTVIFKNHPELIYLKEAIKQYEIALDKRAKVEIQNIYL